MKNEQTTKNGKEIKNHLSRESNTSVYYVMLEMVKSILQTSNFPIALLLPIIKRNFVIVFHNR
jgi:hypothetical protein